MKYRALEAALNAVWAMEPTALETLLTIAAREHEVTPEALEAYQAKTLAKAEQATMRDGVAILDVNGALIKRATFFSAMSGASSYDVLRRDLQAAVDDPKVKAILLNVDSPGGEASGANELAQAVKAAAEMKPVMAYVNGMAASAAYWIASAVGPGNMVIDATAILGSIGAQIAFRERADPAGVTSYRFVSSVSPMKNADPATDEGSAQYQGVVDAMGRVFVEAVATNRDVATSTVLSDFGKGGIFVGRDAVKAGLADRIGNFEGVLAELASGRPAPGKGSIMTHSTTQHLDPRLEAAVAAAMSKAQAAVAPAHVAPAPPQPTAQEIAGRRAEEEKLELDRRVASISGGPAAAAGITAERHVREAEEARAMAAASRKAAAAREDDETASAIAARIAAA